MGGGGVGDVVADGVIVWVVFVDGWCWCWGIEGV